MTACARCRTEQPPHQQAVICLACGRRTETALRDTPTLQGLLQDATCRLDRIDRPTSRHPPADPDAALALTTAVHPLPFETTTADHAHHLTAVITSWAAAVYDRHPLATPPAPPAAVWLADRTHLLREHPAAADAADEIIRAAATGWALVDRPPDTWWIGHCDTRVDTNHWDQVAACGWELRATLGAKVVICPGCGTRHQVADRRQRMLDAAAHQHVTATQAARALTSLDRPITPAAIRGWRHRGHLTPEGVNQAGQPLYRFGDIATIDSRTRYGQTVESSTA